MSRGFLLGAQSKAWGMDERCQALREYCLSLLVFESDNENNTISQTYFRYFAYRVFVPLFVISTKSLLLARMLFLFCSC